MRILRPREKYTIEETKNQAQVCLSLEPFSYAFHTVQWWQRMVQSPPDSQNENWQVHAESSHVHSVSPGVEISMATESISTLANAFIPEDRDLLQFQPY